MEAEKIKTLEKEHIMQTYKRFNAVIDYGKGCRVYGKDGRTYLDFLGGIATCSVGHGNKEVAEAISAQAKKLLNITNLYYTEPQAVLAEKLSRLSGLKKCFFCNSGTEANEAAIKLAKKITKKRHFIAFEHCFHGRTTGSLAATWKPKYREPFMPLAPDVIFVEYDNINALSEAFKDAVAKNKDIAAVIIEPIQGEAGIIVPRSGYLKEVKELCKKNGALLIADEVQSGTGRTGKFFACQHEGVLPDIITTAKGLANGIPIGVCISDLDFERGDHASTFGGNSISCAAANATIEYIMKNNLMENADTIGKYIVKRLDELKNKLKTKSDIISQVRGKGLMIGVVLKRPIANDVCVKCLESGLIINDAGENILRLLPPLSVKKEEADEAVRILEGVLETC